MSLKISGITKPALSAIVKAHDKERMCFINYYSKRLGWITNELNKDPSNEELLSKQRWVRQALRQLGG